MRLAFYCTTHDAEVTTGSGTLVLTEADRGNFDLDRTQLYCTGIHPWPTGDLSKHDIIFTVVSELD